MVQDFVQPGEGVVSLALAALAAGLLPAAAYLTVRGRETARTVATGVTQAYLDTRRLLLLNRRNVERLLAQGLDPLPGPVDFQPPNLGDDLLREGEEIADDERARVEEFLAQDHTEQILRILGDLRKLSDSVRKHHFLAGLNVGILLAIIAGLIGGFVTAGTGIGAIVLILSVVALFLDLVFKLALFGSGLALSGLLEQRRAELRDKEAMFRRLLESEVG